MWRLRVCDQWFEKVSLVLVQGISSDVWPQLKKIGSNMSIGSHGIIIGVDVTSCKLGWIKSMGLISFYTASIPWMC